MLEALVRPFAHTRNATSGVRHTYIPRATTGPVPEPEEGIATICWGRVGDLPEPLSSGFDTLRCEEVHVEDSRETDDVTVTNPNPSDDSYLVVRRANTLRFTKTENKPRSASDWGTSYNISENSFDDFNADVRSSFEPDGGSENKCQLTVRLENGPTSA